MGERGRGDERVGRRDRHPARAPCGRAGGVDVGFLVGARNAGGEARAQQVQIAFGAGA